MTSPISRIRRGAVVLFGFFIVAVCVDYLIKGHGSLLESAYWFVITVSSVGYGEKSSAAPIVQLWTIVVVIVGMSAAAYTVGGFLQLITEGEIERAMGVRRMTRELDKLDGHVIVCGYGRMGRMLVDDLAKQGIVFVVVERDSNNVADGRADDYLVVQGDATEEDVLQSAGIKRAAILVSALDTDADNVFLTLTCRNLSSKLQIIARGEQPSSEQKLLQAGANRVVLPSVIGARRIATLVTRPHMADLIEKVTDHTELDVDLDQLTVTPTSKLANQTVRDAETNRNRRLLVVAIRRSDGQMLFNPDAEDVFLTGDTLIVMGKREDVAQFRETYDL